MTPPATWVRFPALGTYVHLATPGDLDLAENRTREILAAVDLACSRFRPDSDLSRANAAPGTWTPVSALFLAALRVGLAAAATTDGLLDPCLGRTLVDLGYDADFAAVRSRPDHLLLAAPRPASRAWESIGITEDAVRIPDGVALDLGATAKAWASDLVAESLVAELDAPVLISLGGDVRAAAPHGTPYLWAVEVTEHPGGIDETVEPASIWLDGGGLATSSTTVRRWRAGGAEQHHLLDPRTGRPADGPWRTVTATGPTCVAANVASTTAVVLGGDAVDWLDQHDVTARLIARDGSTRQLGGWPEPLTSTSGASCSQH